MSKTQEELDKEQRELTDFVQATIEEANRAADKAVLDRREQEERAEEKARAEQEEINHELQQRKEQSRRTAELEHQAELAAESEKSGKAQAAEQDKEPSKSSSPTDVQIIAGGHLEVARAQARENQEIATQQETEQDKQAKLNELRDSQRHYESVAEQISNRPESEYDPAEWDHYSTEAAMYKEEADLLEQEIERDRQAQQEENERAAAEQEARLQDEQNEANVEREEEEYER